MPIGNGSLGGNILGSVAAERITLNEKRLYGAVVRTQRKELTIIGMSTRNQLTYCLKYDKHLLKGIKKKAEELTRRNFNGLADYEPSRETPFRFGSYTSLGEAYIETGLSEIGMTNYKTRPLSGFRSRCCKLP